MSKMITITRKGSRIEQLTELSKLLAKALDEAVDSESISRLSKQYRETIKEIEEIKGMDDSEDEIDEILSKRKADGKTGAIR